jgi:hypothetical protein
MYGTIRVILGFIFLGCYVAVMRKSKLFRNRFKYILGILLSFAVMTALFFVPVENCFMTFESPEAAYKYTKFGKTNIVHTIEGNESAFVIDRTFNTQTHQIIPKGETGWKIGLGADTKCIYRNFHEGISIDVYRYKNSEEYYLFIEATSADSVELKDSRSSEFYALEADSGHFVTYCTYLPKMDEQYWISVNDVQIVPIT